MKLCLVMPGASGDGPVTGTAGVLRLCAIAAGDHGVEVVVALPQSTPLHESIAPHCSEIETFHSASDKRDFGRNALPMHQLLRRHQPDIVHFHVPSFQWGLDAVLTAGLHRSVRVVRTEHNPLMSPPSRSTAPVLRAADRVVDEFVYVSAGNRRRYEELLSWRSDGTVVTNSVDTELMDAWCADREDPAALRARFDLPDDARVAVFVAGSWNLDDEAGRRPLMPVLEAMALVGDRSWHLLVIGDGPRDEAQREADRLGLGNRVTFVGVVPDAAPITIAADLLVSASHYEGCSISYLEAWYAGVPILVAEVDGVEDVSGPDDMSSLTFDRSDAARFAELWDRAADPDSDLRRANARATETVRERFTDERFKNEMWSVYERHDTT